MTEEPTQTVSHALPAGFVIQEYEFLSVLGMGGFGITYLANDANLKLKVAIKEFFPASLATRDPITNQVAVKSEEYQADFAWGKERFIQEAQTLAKFSHPNIVHIYRYFVANGTGYMVMDYEEGKSLEEVISDKKTMWNDTGVMEFLLPLLDGIAHVHKAGFLHRDIKPSNIVIRKKDSSPVLLDFGSARAALISHTQTLTALISPGYCPVEQYFDDGTQAACTDIYSIGAVLYRIVTGLTPTPSPQRVKKDSMIPAGFAGRQKFGVSLLRAIDKALSIEASKRPQSIEAWQAILEESAQKAELKNISEKASGIVGKGYKRIKIIAPMLVIAMVIILIGYPQGMKYYQGYLDKSLEEQYKRAINGDAVALEQVKTSASNGNSKAQFFMGTTYSGGQGVPRNYLEALKWYRMAAEQGDVHAQANIGRMYFEGRGVPKSNEEALKWSSKAAEQGETNAQYTIGMTYLKRDNKQALEWFRKSAEQGNAEAQNKLGAHAEFYTKDDAEALKWYRKSAEQGNAEAIYTLSSKYMYGLGGAPKNEREGIELLRKSAEKGYAQAQLGLGSLYFSGYEGFIRRDYAEAVKWYRKAEEQGDVTGKGLMARMYQDGLGIPQDYAEARKKWGELIYMGNRGYNVNIGVMYLNGWGVPRDPSKAMDYFYNAANVGDHDAEYQLGKLFRSGFSSPISRMEPSYENAVIMFRRAVVGGIHYDAQNALGEMYQNGQGVTKDYAEAMKWYSKAAVYSNVDANNNIANMYELGLGVPKNHEQAEIWRKNAQAASEIHKERSLSNGGDIAANHVVVSTVEGNRASAQVSSVEDAVTVAAIASQPSVIPAPPQVIVAEENAQRASIGKDKITVGMTENELFSSIGSPDHIMPAEDNGSVTRIYQRPKQTVFVQFNKEHRIERITFFDTVAKGVTEADNSHVIDTQKIWVGMTEIQTKAVIGKPNTIVTSNGAVTWMYQRGKQHVHIQFNKERRIEHIL